MRNLIWMGVLAACGGDETAMMTTTDLGSDQLPAIDLAKAASGHPTGSACGRHDRCDDGFCWRSSSGNGICTHGCVDDRDCGAGEMCRLYSTGRFCAKSCGDGSDCPAGFACFIGLGCYPADVLDCDPRQSRCLIGDREGGCVRYALGDGNTGLCFFGCLLGDDCPTARDGYRETCVFYDDTPAGDGFRGLICVPSSPVQNPVGAACLDGDGRYSPWACVDGAECDLAGDGRCHALCALEESIDGCECKDVFHAAGTTTAVGLCE